MKKLGQIRENYDLITEKEEAESRKLTTLVRAGLFDPKKLPMLKRALSKDAKDMTPAERKILIELLDSLMAEVLQSQQVYSKVKQNVMMKEEKDFEYEMARTELKTLIHDAQKILSNLKGEGNLEAWVQSKITKAADYINAAADNITHSDETVSEAKTFDGYYSKYDPRYSKMPSEREIPTVIILKRKAIRIYPDNQKVALYYSQALDKYVTIPFGAMQDGMNEEVKSDEDNPYVVKSTYTKYKNPEDKKNIARMQGELNKMKSKMASGGYKSDKSKKTADEVIKTRAAALTKAIDKASKETATKKTDLSKKNPSELSKGNFKRLMKGISKDDDMNLATKIGTKVGLKARRAFDKGSAGAKNINTTFEETQIINSFKNKLDVLRESNTKTKTINPADVDIRDIRRPGDLDKFRAPTKVEPKMSSKADIDAFLDSAKKTMPANRAKIDSSIKNVVKKGVRAVKKLSPIGAVTSPIADAKLAGEKPEELPVAKTIAKVKGLEGQQRFRPAVPSTDTPKKVEPVKVPTPSSPAEAVPTISKTVPKSDTKTDVKTDTKTDKKAPSRESFRKRASSGAALAGAAALAALGGFNSPRKRTEQDPFTLKAKTSKPVGNVRTSVDARDTSMYRKAMQQNESVLNQLYGINENEEKSINIDNESVVINNTVAKKIIGVYESVNKQNKEKIESMLNESVDSFKKIASFAARQ